MIGESDQTIAARRSLLDGLQALGAHSSALVVVGAQAIYLRVGDAYAAVAPFTTDGDLLLDPAFLSDDPEIESLMTAAGFQLKAGDVGVWNTEGSTVTVDLLVPASVGGSGRRGARLGVHGNRVAKKVNGLEGALVDRDVLEVGSNDPTDPRSFRAQIGGPAALMVSKLHKLSDRRDQPRRLDNKDALDVFRLLQGVSSEELAARFGFILADARSEPVGRRGVLMLGELFGTTTAPGSQMAADAVAAVGDADFVAASCAALAGELKGLIAS